MKPYEHIYAIMDGLKAKEVILFLDEPSLGHARPDYPEMWEAIFHDFNVIKGVHVCSNMDWDAVFKANIEIISFDASQFDITIYKNYRSGKRIAWGVENLEDVKDFQDGDLITKPCGIGTYPVEACDDIFKKLDGIASKFYK